MPRDNPRPHERRNAGLLVLDSLPLGIGEHKNRTVDEHPQREILKAIWSLEDGYNQDCYPGRAFLGRKAGIKIRQVSTALGVLKTLSLIIVTPCSGGTNRYRIDWQGVTRVHRSHIGNFVMEKYKVKIVEALALMGLVATTDMPHGLRVDWEPVVSADHRTRDMGTHDPGHEDPPTPDMMSHDPGHEAPGTRDIMSRPPGHDVPQLVTEEKIQKTKQSSSSIMPELHSDDGDDEDGFSFSLVKEEYSWDEAARALRAVRLGIWKETIDSAQRLKRKPKDVVDAAYVVEHLPTDPIKPPLTAGAIPYFIEKRCWPQSGVPNADELRYQLADKAKREADARRLAAEELEHRQRKADDVRRRVYELSAASECPDRDMLLASIAYDLGEAQISALMTSEERDAWRRWVITDGKNQRQAFEKSQQNAVRKVSFVLDKPSRPPLSQSESALPGQASDDPVKDAVVACGPVTAIFRRPPTPEPLASRKAKAERQLAAALRGSG